MNHAPSPEQAEIFRLVDTEPSHSLLIRASAGSGKTTTIVAAASRLPTSHMQRFLAFNKSIAMELTERLPKSCEATTFHSLGNSAIRNSGRKPRINTGKMAGIVKKLLNKPKEMSLYMGPVLRLVSYAKNAGLGTLTPDTPESWKSLIDLFALDCDGDELRLIELARSAFQLSINAVNEIDFDDMLFWPVHFNLEFNRCSTVFVDEAQDTNALQLDILKRLRFPTGRVIAVGDPSQAIYGFRGASSDALTRLKTTFNMTVLPLSVSYRCSHAVVAEARKYDTGTI